MIECEVIDEAEDHLLVRSTEPCRIEVSVCKGELILHVYTGAEVDEEQQPVGGYLGSEPCDSWKHEGEDGRKNQPIQGRVLMACDEVRRAVAHRVALEAIKDGRATAGRAAFNMIDGRLDQLNMAVTRTMSVPGVVERLVSESDGCLAWLTGFVSESR